MTVLLVSFPDPDDYAGGQFDIIFRGPNTRVCINISITTDNIFEDDEAFLIVLSSDDPALFGVPVLPVAILDLTRM